VFIAGNEPFTQGPVSYEDACRAAVDRDVVVNTIFCGRRQQGIETRWEDGALLTDGTYASIDQGIRTTHLTTPQDDEIARLGAALNATYLPYGKDGADGMQRQERQDSNAQGAARGTGVARSLVKASPHYVSAGWDLVDALRTGVVSLSELDERDLPEGMRPMSLDERQAYVEDMMRQRVEIQNRIRGLSQERARFLAERHRELGGSEPQSLDRAIIDAIRAQGERADLEFENEE